jgi:hypothetical protein
MLFILVAAWMILLHLLEYCGVGGVLRLEGGDGRNAVGHSTSAWTPTQRRATVIWSCAGSERLLGGIERDRPILMAGWSTGFSLPFASRLHTIGGDAARSKGWSSLTA